MANSGERMITVNGVELCAEAFGDPAQPPILLIMGIGASMLWWEDGFCRLLAAHHFVIRYDLRDTGRSVTYEVGQPGYTTDDLVDDVPGLLDAYDLAHAHVVGVSAGGALAQLVALDYPDRVRSLTLISTSPAHAVRRALPPPTSRFTQFLAGVQVDWTDAASVVQFNTDYARMLAGGRRPFAEAAMRDLVQRDVERADNFAAVQNHNAIPEGTRSRPPLSALQAPTLILHGDADPMFPLEHGQALASEIPHARLITLHDAGHGVDRADWTTITEAITNHTHRTEG